MIEGIGLAAEAAAVGHGDDANMRGAHLERFGERAMYVVRSLRTRPENEFSIRIFRCHRSVLLDWQVRVALIEKCVFEHMVGTGKRLLNIPETKRNDFVDIAPVAVLVNARLLVFKTFFR